MVRRKMLSHRPFDITFFCLCPLWFWKTCFYLVFLCQKIFLFFQVFLTINRINDHWLLFDYFKMSTGWWWDKRCYRTSKSIHLFRGIAKFVNIRNIVKVVFSKSIEVKRSEIYYVKWYYLWRCLKSLHNWNVL